MVKSTPKGIQRGAKKMAKTIRERQKTEKQQLLEALEESPNLGQALTRVGINRSTYYRWRQDDQVFALNADNAMWNGREKTADMVEMSLLGKARDGSVQAQKIYLEHNHPRYKRYGLFDTEETDGKLSLERQEQIAKAMKNWFYKPSSDDSQFIKS